MALFHEEEYEGAKEAFEAAKGLGSTGEVNRWLGKCNAELEGVLHSFSGGLPSLWIYALRQWPSIAVTFHLTQM